MISIIFISIIITYLFVIGAFCFGFDKVKLFYLQDLKSKTTFSIIIPFRNEADHLPQLLDSIQGLNYPKALFEIIFVDDDSEDNSVTLIEKALSNSNNTSTFKYSIIKNNRYSCSPKKDAIITAVNVAQYNWIITTDADCILPKYWLEAFDEYIQNKSLNCIVAPVTYSKYHSFFKRFQTLDFLSLQGTAIGSFGLKMPFMCNGANFAYKVSAFKDINGFEGNTCIASGDDVFLLEKFKKLDLKKVGCLKSQKAFVKTNAVGDCKTLIQQRLRWASKTSRNPNIFSKVIGIIVFLANFTCVAIPLLLLLNQIKPRIAIALLIIKLSIDFLLLFKSARFFKQERVLISYVGSSLLYPFFCIYIVLLSLFASYQWKGRTFKK